MNSEHEDISLLKQKEATARCGGSHRNVSQISPLDSPLGFGDSMFCGCSGRLLGRGFSASFVSCPVSLVPLNDDATRVQLFVPCPYYTHSPRICSLTTWFPCRIMQTDNSHSNICSLLLTPVEIWRPIGPLCLSLLRGTQNQHATNSAPEL